MISSNLKGKKSTMVPFCSLPAKTINTGSLGRKFAMDCALTLDPFGIQIIAIYFLEIASSISTLLCCFILMLDICSLARCRYFLPLYYQQNGRVSTLEKILYVKYLDILLHILGAQFCTRWPELCNVKNYATFNRNVVVQWESVVGCRAIK